MPVGPASFCLVMLMCMSMCMYVYVYAYVCVRVCADQNKVDLLGNTYIHIHTYMHTYTFLFVTYEMCVYLYVCVNLRMCMCLCEPELRSGTLIFIKTFFFSIKKTQVHNLDPKRTGSVFVLSVWYQYSFFLCYFFLC